MKTQGKCICIKNYKSYFIEGQLYDWGYYESGWGIISEWLIYPLVFDYEAFKEYFTIEESKI